MDATYPTPEIYIVISAPKGLSLQQDIATQCLPLEQRQRLFIFLPTVRAISITQAFVILHSRLSGPLTPRNKLVLEEMKNAGIIDAYRVVDPEYLMVRKKSVEDAPLDSPRTTNPLSLSPLWDKRRT